MDGRSACAMIAIAPETPTGGATGRLPARWGLSGKWWHFGMAVVTLGYLAGMLYLRVAEEWIWFRPAPATYGDWQPRGLAIEEAAFRSADGTPLKGWFVPHAAPRAVVLYCPGSGGNSSYYAPVLRRLHDELRLSVMIFDYRGFGRSGGQLAGEAALMADARAARRWVSERAGVRSADLVLMGRSLGTGVAVQLATETGARGLVLESPFTSLPDVAYTYYRWLPIRLPMRYRFESVRKIDEYLGPTLAVSSTSDRVVRPHLVKRVFAAAHEPKQLVWVTGLAHDDAWGEEYYRALDAFVERLPHHGIEPPVGRRGPTD